LRAPPLGHLSDWIAKRQYFGQRSPMPNLELSGSQLEVMRSCSPDAGPTGARHALAMTNFHASLLLGAALADPLLPG